MADNQLTYLTNMANGVTSSGSKANSGQVTWAKAQLKTYVPPTPNSNLTQWQESETAKGSSNVADTTNQVTGGGVGATNPVYAPVYPGNTIVPDLTSDAVKGYGFTAVVGLGVALLVVSLMGSFRRVRGR